MDQRAQYLKAIRYQKTGVDVFFNLLSSLQQGSQTMVTQALDQSSWIPPGSRKSCVLWFEECSKGLEVMKDVVDKGVSGLDQFWPANGEEKAVKSSPVPAAAKKTAAKSAAVTPSKSVKDADKPKTASVKSAAKRSAAAKKKAAPVKAAPRKTAAVKAVPKKKVPPRKTAAKSNIETDVEKEKVAVRSEPEAKVVAPPSGGEAAGSKPQEAKVTPPAPSTETSDKDKTGSAGTKDV